MLFSCDGNYDNFEEVVDTTGHSCLNNWGIILEGIFQFTAKSGTDRFHSADSIRPKKVNNICLPKSMYAQLIHPQAIEPIQLILADCLNVAHGDLGIE